MGSLASLLIPLIPGAIKSLMDIINTIRDHPDTPAAAQAQLATISAQLDTVATQVAAVKV